MTLIIGLWPEKTGTLNILANKGKNNKNNTRPGKTIKFDRLCAIIGKTVFGQISSTMTEKHHKHNIQLQTDMYDKFVTLIITILKIIPKIFD